MCHTLIVDYLILRYLNCAQSSFLKRHFNRWQKKFMLSNQCIKTSKLWWKKTEA